MVVSPYRVLLWLYYNGLWVQCERVYGVEDNGLIISLHVCF